MTASKHRVHARRGTRLGAVAFALAFALVALLPGAASAAIIPYGSNLSAPADTVEAHGADSAFWNVGTPGGAAPADGQITVVRVKGSVVADPTGRITPNPEFHFQVLHPVGGGELKVALSSAPFWVPVGGNSQAISSYNPVNLCVFKGDYVDFNDIGGFQYRWGTYGGMPFQVFSTTPNAATNFYTKDNGTNVGTQWAPQETHANEELLMATTLATGPDATDFCPGGYRQHVFQGLTIRAQTSTLSTSRRTLKVKTSCPGQTYGACRGVLVLKATVNGSVVTLGGTAFSVKPAYSVPLTITLSQANVGLVKRLKSVKAVATSNAKDNPDPSVDSRVRSTVPVQSKTTSGTVTVVPGS